MTWRKRIRQRPSLLLGRAFGVFALVVASLAFPAPATNTAAGTTTFAWSATISPDANVTTADFTVSFTGLDANSAIQLSLQPTNLVVGDQFATAAGTAEFMFKIPSSTQPGDYNIRSVGISNSGNSFTVTVATFTVAPSGAVSGSTVRDGVLTLEIVAGSVAAFQDPAVEAGLSITRGTLSTFVVRDERAASKPGWIVMASVSPLTLSTDTTVIMTAAQLGIAPLVIAGGIGVSAGQATVAGSATYPFEFAASPAGVQAPTTTLGGNLTLLAPPQLPVGTYNGTITLTLMSR